MTFETISPVRCSLDAVINSLGFFLDENDAEEKNVQKMTLEITQVSVHIQFLFYMPLVSP
jgi:hypothetical protein